MMKMMKTGAMTKISLVALLAVAVLLTAAVSFCPTEAYEANAATYARDVNPPKITLTPTDESGYASSVEVTIQWENTDSYKFYSVKGRTGIESGEIRYAAPFTITAEGVNEIKAYYFDTEGVKRYVTATVDYIDSTPPPSSAIAESIRCEIDLTAATPMLLTLRASDALSGVKRVYIKNFGREFYLKDGADSLYAVDCAGLSGYVYVTVEDNAGNTTDYGYQLNGYDITTINEYSAKFAALDESVYAREAWDGILEAYKNLSTALGDPATSSSVISSFKRAADEAADTAYRITTVYSASNADVPTGIDASAAYGYTDRPAGDALTLTAGECAAANYEDMKNTASAASGYLTPVTYAFSLALTSDDGAATVYREIEISANMPAGAEVAKVYYCNSEGVLELLSSEIRDGRLYFYTDSFGDFYLVSDLEYANNASEGDGLTIGDKFYPADTLWTAGGIILGVAVLGGLITVAALLIVNKKRGR